MTKQTFNGTIFVTSPAQSPRSQSAPNNHPLAPLTPVFHARSNVRVVHYHVVTVLPVAGLAAQQQINNLPTVTDEGCWDKLMKCLRIK